MTAKTPAEGQKHDKDEEDNTGPVNILIVDDEPRNLTVLESVLDDPGYRLVRAHSGDDALLALMGQEFAVLVLDVHMPGMSGFELAQIVKQRKRTAAIPIIFLTAHFNDDEHAIAGYGTGAVDYLHKPVNPAVLRTKVAVFADLHRKSQRLAREVAERRAAEERLSALNASLDQRVAERTAALAQSEARLREANARKDDFLATLAHELRNPLAPIRNAMLAVQAKSAGDPELERLTALIDRQVRSMTRLIEDLMDVNRIDRGKFELRREVIDLHLAVDDALETVAPLIEECGHELQVHKAPGPLLVDADRARLAQALVNLLANGAKYTERGGRITLATRREGGEVAVSVRDTGIGIAPDRLQKVFEMFSQEEAALERSRGGIGIGLALSRRIVDMHQGSITARSEGRGRGSEFEVRMPAVQRELAPVPAAAPVRHEPSPSLRILIADDNDDAASALGALLQVMGHSVMEVHDGEAAVAATEGFDPQLVLLDIGMPRLNGYEACSRIRSLPGDHPRTIAAVSGWGQAKDVARSKAAGFDHHLVKPIEIAALHGLLRRAAAPGAPD